MNKLISLIESVLKSELWVAANGPKPHVLDTLWKRRNTAKQLACP